MTQSTESTHVHRLIPDYVLGLLPGDQASRVAAHASRCDDCGRILAREQDIGRTAKATLSRMTAPDRDRLRSLMPAPPASTGARAAWLLRSPGLAAAGILLLILFSAVALFAFQQPGVWGVSAPTARATAVMLTETPTQTATREMTATAEGLAAIPSPSPMQHSAAAYQAAPPAPAMVPIPPAPWLP